MLRIVIFNKWPIVNVHVSIDSQVLGNAFSPKDNPNLFVLPWNASQFNDGKLHRISVEIKVRRSSTPVKSSHIVK